MATGDDGVQCQEVWGGNVPAEGHWTRPGLDLWIWSRSQERVESGGNDLHLISSCASGRITRMLLADVCGRGTVFSEIASELRELMKRNVNSMRHYRLVREMSRRLELVAERGGFASTLVSTYFAPTRMFTLCNAGHPPPLLYRAAKQSWSVWKQLPRAEPAGEVPLGVVAPEQYQHFQARLAPGDMVLAYSNSLTECRSAQGQLLGVQGLVQRVQELDADHPADLAARLARRIQGEFAGNLERQDATVLLCRVNDSAVAWRDNVLALFRLLRAVSDRTRFSTG